jgi:hypothetical protein
MRKMQIYLSVVDRESCVVKEGSFSVRLELYWSERRDYCELRPS